jgi:small-conductance mechanosensitive channel
MRLLVAIFLALHALLASAQVAPEPAVVSIYNRPVTVFRASFLGLSPAERARRTEQALQDLLARGGPGEVTVQEVPQGRVVMVDGSLAIILTPQDADALRGQNLDGATRATVDALKRAIAETRESRDRRRLLEAVAHALAATAIFAGLVWAVLRLRRAVGAGLAAWVEAAGARAHVGPIPLWQPARLRTVLHLLLRGLSWLLLAGLVYEWLVYLLQLFPRTRAAGEQLGGFVLNAGERIGNGVLDSLPDLAVATVIFALAWAVTALVRPAFDRAEQGLSQFGWLDRDLARPTRRIFGLAVWLFAVVMAYPYLPGAQTEAFKGMSVLVGLMVTLGGSSLFGQAASGLILMYSRTLRIGEYVRISGTEGTIVEMGTFTTRIRTGMGEEVTLPNALVMGSVIGNFSRAVQGHGYVVDTGVTIGYDTPWREVEAMLVEAARRTPGVLAQPEPRVLQRALSDFYIDYHLVCQAIPETPRARAEVLNELHANIVDVFNEHGVQIMSPHYLGDPPEAKVVPPGRPYAGPVPRKDA